MPADLQSDCDKVLTALRGAVRLSRQDIYALFGRHRTLTQIEDLASALETRGAIIRLRLEPAGGNERHPTEVWEITSPSREMDPPTVQVDAPPPGEGWVPKLKTLKRAQRGVVPAVAARAGRLIRKRKAKDPRVAIVSDEQRGAAHLIGTAYRGYVKQGVIEVNGDWMRLVKNPPRRPPHHWYEALLHFVAEGHPTLDGKWRRKPKRTLVSVMEDALGRKLEENEQVRRRPGAAGSWNPHDIGLTNWDSGTFLTLAQVRGDTE